MDYQAMESQLNGSYREVFARTVLYACTTGISTEEADEHLADLFDLLLTAQEEQKPVEKLVGRNLEQFCKDYFEDYTLMDRLKFLPQASYRLSWIILVFELLDLLFPIEDMHVDFFRMQTDISGFVIGAGVGVLYMLLLHTLFTPLVMKHRKIKPGVWYMLMFVMLVVLIAASVILVGDATYPVPVWLLLVLSAGYITVYLIGRSVLRYQKYGTIRNIGKQLAQDSYYKNLENKDLEIACLEGWEIRWKRLDKKKKIPPEAFLPLLQKEDRISDRMQYGYAAIFIVVSLSVVIGSAEVNSVTDTILFAVVLAVVEYLLYRVFRRNERKIAAIRKRLLRQCEASGKTMPEYIEEALTEHRNAQKS